MPISCTSQISFCSRNKGRCQISWTHGFIAQNRSLHRPLFQILILSNKKMNGSVYCTECFYAIIELVVLHRSLNLWKWQMTMNLVQNFKLTANWIRHYANYRILKKVWFLAFLASPNTIEVMFINAWVTYLLTESWLTKTKPRQGVCVINLYLRQIGC